MVVKVLLYLLTALSSFRSAIARAVWSKELPMTDTPALLSLLGGPWGSDRGFLHHLESFSSAPSFSCVSS